MIICTCTHAAPSEPPQNVSGTFINSTSIIVTWAPPPVSSHNGIIRHYIIRYSLVTDSSDVQSVNTSELSIMIGDLERYTEYMVSVSAVTVEEGVSSLVIVRTDSDGK